MGLQMKHQDSLKHWLQLFPSELEIIHMIYQPTVKSTDVDHRPNTGRGGKFRTLTQFVSSCRISLMVWYIWTKGAFNNYVDIKRGICGKVKSLHLVYMKKGRFYIECSQLSTRGGGWSKFGEIWFI